jgi:hypothetical protein
MEGTIQLGEVLDLYGRHYVKIVDIDRPRKKLIVELNLPQDPEPPPTYIDPKRLKLAISKWKLPDFYRLFTHGEGRVPQSRAHSQAVANDFQAYVLFNGSVKRKVEPKFTSALTVKNETKVMKSVSLAEYRDILYHSCVNVSDLYLPVVLD